MNRARFWLNGFYYGNVRIGYGSVAEVLYTKSGTFGQKKGFFPMFIKII